jgi:hypothetical protein
MAEPRCSVCGSELRWVMYYGTGAKVRECPKCGDGSASVSTPAASSAQEPPPTGYDAYLDRDRRIKAGVAAGKRSFWKRLFSRRPAPSTNKVTGAGEGGTGSSGIKFIREEKGVDAVLGTEPAVKRIYSAPNRDSAIEFLRRNPVSKRMFFIEIDTPEGRVGRDINGLYDDKGNIGESSSGPTKVVVVFGNSVPLSKLENSAKVIAGTSGKGIVLCGPTFEAAMAASNLVVHLTPGGASTARVGGVSMKDATERLFKYRTLSPCTLVFYHKLPKSSFDEIMLNNDSLFKWYKEHFAKTLLNHLNAQNFGRENMPKTNLEACREDLSVAVISSWGSVDGDICKKYALALELAQRNIRTV